MIRILANDGMEASAIEMLEKAGFQVDTNKVAQENLAEALKNYDAITVRSATKVRKDLIDACPNLKLIGRGGVGMDNIDVEYARSKGIRVVNTPAASSASVAEMVFAHIFSAVRNLAESNRLMPEKGTTDFSAIKKASEGVELRGKAMGIIGFGRIGQETAKIAFGLGMDVYAYDPYVAEAEIYLHLGATAGNQRIKIPVKTVSKEEVLQKADFVSLHVPFNEGDAPVIGAPEMAKMKKGAGIVNCARGGAVNESDLIEAMANGQIAYAGLDVFAKEPPVDDRVLKVKGISLSAHVGGSTKEAQSNIGAELAEKIIDFFNSGK
ncbi:MAG: D-2-hydroxyacid dehydrogenase [Bacteroidota bacterium]|nr:D-2-hydroxyacid dehydrogenase [Bacteroidota bacterium]MDX5431678.1 D-2-hydroxyacid dehydrogenase [Bacteroidota bacterium]MDX5470393.1 D-2-hydroxyacid dehydrogenase [Bacteroidota bacterium]